MAFPIVTCQQNFYFVNCFWIKFIRSSLLIQSWLIEKLLFPKLMIILNNWNIQFSKFGDKMANISYKTVY